MRGVLPCPPPMYRPLVPPALGSKSQQDTQLQLQIQPVSVLVLTCFSQNLRKRYSQTYICCGNLFLLWIFSVKWEHRCSDRWCFIETMAATAPWPEAAFSRQCHGRVAEARCSRCSSSLWMISARWMIECSIIAARPLSPTKRIRWHAFFSFSRTIYGGQLS